MELTPTGGGHSAAGAVDASAAVGERRSTSSPPVPDSDGSVSPPPPRQLVYLSMPCRDDELNDIDTARINAHGDNNPTSAENAGSGSETRLSEAMKKLRGAVATRYSLVPTIYRVPDELKDCPNGDWRQYYSPVAIYLGCFARGYEHIHSKTEAYKWCCVRQLIGLPVETGEARELLRGCLESMHRLLPRVRASYYELATEEGYGYENDGKMAMRMVGDGCLILHRLLKYARTEREEDDDWTLVFGRCFVWQSVTRDLLLLENQIPFFVVKELFQLLKNEGESEELLFTGSLRLFRSLGLQMRDLLPDECGNIHHLLHLFYLSVGFPQQGVPVPYRNKERGVFLLELTQWVPSAKELEEAGVRIRKRRNATSFLDITFDYRRGVLEIPPLQLDDSCSALFRNMIAFEQAYPATRCDVSTYAVFMDCLINTPEDMRILHLRGILVNQMNGEQDASRFFSKICAQVHVPADNYLVSLMEKVSKYKESRRHNWRAALVLNYFGNPWLAMSVIAAVLLLALTVLQTFFTVYPYYKPSG